MQACGHTPIFSGQRIERTNARGRHNYTLEFKRWIVEQAKMPGTSVSGLAMSNQVNANQLRRWIQLHSQHGAGPTNTGASATSTLLPVTIAAQEPPAAPVFGKAAADIEIELAGATIRVRDGVAPSTLRMVLACLRAMP